MSVLSFYHCSPSVRPFMGEKVSLPFIRLISVKLQVELNILDGAHCCFLLSFRSNNRGLFSVQAPRIQHPKLHILLLRDSQKATKAPILQILQLVTCRNHHLQKQLNVFCMRGKQRCITKRETARLYWKLYHFIAGTPRPVAFTALDAFFMITENNYCSSLLFMK